MDCASTSTTPGRTPSTMFQSSPTALRRAMGLDSSAMCSVLASAAGTLTSMQLACSTVTLSTTCPSAAAAPLVQTCRSGSTKLSEVGASAVYPPGAPVLHI